MSLILLRASEPNTEPHLYIERKKTYLLPVNVLSSLWLLTTVIGKKKGNTTASAT